MGQDALRPEGGRPEDVDHLLEVAQLPLKVLEVLLDPGALALGELEAQVEQGRNGLANGEPLPAGVGADPLLQAVVQPDSYLVSLRFHSFLHSLSQPQSQRPGPAEHPQRFPDWLGQEAGHQTKRHASGSSLGIAREGVQTLARADEAVEPAASQTRETARLPGSQEEDADRAEGATLPSLCRHEDRKSV